MQYIFLFDPETRAGVMLKKHIGSSGWKGTQIQTHSVHGSAPNRPKPNLWRILPWTCSQRLTAFSPAPRCDQHTSLNTSASGSFSKRMGIFLVGGLNHSEKYESQLG